jgi:hypothetical protein
MSYFDDPAGTFELDSVAGLLNVNVVHPGEKWSDARASGTVTPGEPIVEVASGANPDATLVVRRAESGDAVADILLAQRVVDIPDPNNGPNSLSPNAVKNQDIPAGEWIMRLVSGVFDLTLVTPDTYVPGEKIGWDLDGARPTGKATTHAGAWAKDAKADIKAVFKVVRWREINSSTKEGILTVKFIGRQQF